MDGQKLAELGKGTRFTSERQPEKRGRTPGKRSAATVARDILNLPASSVLGSDLPIVNPLTGETADLEFVMTLRQVEKAINKNDTYAYEAVMARAYGKPKQEQEQGDTDNGQDIDLSRLNDVEAATFLRLLMKARGYNEDGTRADREHITEVEVLHETNEQKDVL